VSRLVEWVKQNPVLAVLTGAAGFLLWQVPIGFLQAWSALDHKTLPDWLAAHGWPRLMYLLLGWYGLFAFVILAVAILLTRASRSSLEAIKPYYDRLVYEEKLILDEVMIPLGIAPGNLNVGQLNALEGVCNKTSFVKCSNGKYELVVEHRRSLQVLISRDKQFKAAKKLIETKYEPSTAANLMLTYNGGRYDHIERSGGVVNRRVVRLQLENVGSRVIEGIKVKAESFTHRGTRIPQVPLRISHDEGNHKKDGFSLSPGDKELIDIAERDADSDLIRLCHPLSHEFVTQEENFKIKVIVTATDQPKQEKRLRITTDDLELLHCDPLK
jgi:hypothetical protein